MSLTQGVAATRAALNAAPRWCSRGRWPAAPGGWSDFLERFATGVAPTRDAAVALARKYRDDSAVARALSMAFTHMHITLQQLGLSDEQAMLFDRLASRVFGADRSCISPPDLASNTLGQSHLWSYAISGDLPIVLVRVADVATVALARDVARAQEYWRVKGLRADVVILNEHPADYLDEVQRELTALVQEPRWASWRDKPGGIFLLRTEGMPPADSRLLAAVAGVVLRSDQGDLQSQLQRSTPWLFAEEDVPLAAPLIAGTVASTPLPAPPLVLGTPLGGFTVEGREFVVILDGDRETPLPWSNVLANPTFGTMVSAAGASFTWADNSRENRLTPFANDPLVDPTSEAIYLRDEESGAVWGATPGPLPRQAGGRWLVRHGAGVTRFQHAVAGLEQELTVLVTPEDPVKVSLLTLTNTSRRPRRLSIFGYVEWCLGPPSADGAASSSPSPIRPPERSSRTTAITRSSNRASPCGCRLLNRERTPVIGASSLAAIDRSVNPRHCSVPSSVAEAAPASIPVAPCRSMCTSSPASRGRSHSCWARAATGPTRSSLRRDTRRSSARGRRSTRPSAPGKRRSGRCRCAHPMIRSMSSSTAGPSTRR